METGWEVLRIVVGTGLVVLGLAFLSVNWGIAVRYIYQRTSHRAVKRSSMVPPVGPLLIWAGAAISNLLLLSFVGWWVILIDPATYSIASIPFYLLYVHLRKRKGDA